MIESIKIYFNTSDSYDNLFVTPDRIQEGDVFTTTLIGIDWLIILVLGGSLNSLDPVRKIFEVFCLVLNICLLFLYFHFGYHSDSREFLFNGLVLGNIARLLRLLRHSLRALDSYSFLILLRESVDFDNSNLNEPLLPSIDSINNSGMYYGPFGSFTAVNASTAIFGANGRRSSMGQGYGLKRTVFNSLKPGNIMTDAGEQLSTEKNISSEDNRKDKNIPLTIFERLVGLRNHLSIKPSISQNRSHSHHDHTHAVDNESICCKGVSNPSYSSHHHHLHHPNCNTDLARETCYLNVGEISLNNDKPNNFPGMAIEELPDEKEKTPLKFENQPGISPTFHCGKNDNDGNKNCFEVSCSPLMCSAKTCSNQRPYQSNMNSTNNRFNNTNSVNNKDIHDFPCCGDETAGQVTMSHLASQRACSICHSDTDGHSLLLADNDNSTTNQGVSHRERRLSGVDALIRGGGNAFASLMLEGEHDIEGSGVLSDRKWLASELI